METVSFIDLEAQYSELKARIDEAVSRVFSHGRFIMGPEVYELERQLGRYCGSCHVITCSSGTDALLLPLLAWGVGPGDAVFVPAFTFVATAEVVALIGATPVFVDVSADTYDMDARSLERAIIAANRSGLKARVVVPVDLFGQPADYQGIGDVAEMFGICILSDGAQSFGAEADGKRVGTFGHATATSFFPAKPLGCYGDGGAVMTDDDELAETLRSLRVHGQGSTKYDNVRVGINGRLDTLQAAILLEKLRVFDTELASRRAVASRYSSVFHQSLRVPSVRDGVKSAWAQYTVLVEHRDRVATELNGRGIPTAVYYPAPLNEQKGYRRFPSDPQGVPVSRWLAERVLSLPMHPYLTEADQAKVSNAVADVAEGVLPIFTVER